jgi:DNA-binding response OmpR family regulator
VADKAGPCSRYALDFTAVSNQKVALALVRKTPPDIVLVETDARPNSRVRFCHKVRYRLPTVTILAVGEHSRSDAVACDGILPTPMTADDVLSTIVQIYRRSEGYQVRRGAIQLDIATRTVATPSGCYRITPKQCALLHLLMSHHGEVVERSHIMKSIWNTSYMDDTRTLDVHIRWLRERIEPDPSSPIYLTTVRGVGYRLGLP